MINHDGNSWERFWRHMEKTTKSPEALEYKLITYLFMADLWSSFQFADSRYCILKSNKVRVRFEN